MCNTATHCFTYHVHNQQTSGSVSNDCLRFLCNQWWKKRLLTLRLFYPKCLHFSSRLHRFASGNRKINALLFNVRMGSRWMSTFTILLLIKVTMDLQTFQTAGPREAIVGHFPLLRLAMTISSCHLKTHCERLVPLLQTCAYHYDPFMDLGELS